MKLPPRSERRAFLRSRGWKRISGNGSEYWTHPRFPYGVYSLAPAYRVEEDL